MTRTYSSIREAMQCGILDETAATGTAAPPQDAPPSSSSDAAAGVPGARRPSRRSSSWTINSSFTSGSSTSIASSFAAGTGRRPSYRPDTRRSSFQSSFGSIDEDSAPGMIAIREIRLSNDSPEPEEMDLSEMDVADLDRLKAEDPFAYFSIPEVRRRSYRMEGGAASDILREILQDDPMMDEPQEEDAADASHQGPPPGEARRSRSRNQRGLAASMPAGMLADADIARAQFDDRSSRSVVSKRSRLSCEAHPTLVCEELLLGLANGDDAGLMEGGGDAGAGAGEEDEMMAEERLLQMMMANAAAEGGWGQDPAE